MLVTRACGQGGKVAYRTCIRVSGELQISNVIKGVRDTVENIKVKVDYTSRKVEGMGGFALLFS